jgi:hypothetical protein
MPLLLICHSFGLYLYRQDRTGWPGHCLSGTYKEEHSAMFRKFGTLVIALALFGFAASAVLADSPHFSNVNGPASANLSSSTLTVSFKEAGLGNNQNILYTLSASGSAVYECVNGGGKNPSAANKETVNGPVSAIGTFSSGKNGAINGSLTLSPPSAGTFSCPGGQKLVLKSVSYTGVSLCDTTNNVCAPAPSGTFSYTNPNAP